MYRNGVYRIFNAVDADNFLVKLNEDAVGLAKDSTLLGSYLYLDHISDRDISVTNNGTAAAYLDAFSEPIAIDETGEYAMEMAIDTATTVKLSITSGTKTYSYLMNHGNALAANAWYVFDGVMLAANDQINLQIEVAAGATVTGVLRLFRRR